MMTKKKTSARRLIRFTWALPALALLLFAFAEPQYSYTETEIVGNKLVPAETQSEKQFTIHGKVVSKETGEAIPGASIIIKGTTTGTVSDRDGTFTLVDPNPKESDSKACYSEIVVSFVGLETSLLTVSSIDNKLEIKIPPIKMEEAVQVLYNPNYSGEQMMPPPPPPMPAAEKAKPAKSENPPPPPPPVSNGEKEVFHVVEDIPKYPGGFGALQEHVGKMQKKLAREKNLKGKATVTFTVNPKGKVTDIKVVEKDNDAVAKGAYAIANELEEWKPGKQRGKAVPVKYMLPVEFK